MIIINYNTLYKKRKGSMCHGGRSKVNRNKQWEYWEETSLLYKECQPLVLEEIIKLANLHF